MILSSTRSTFELSLGSVFISRPGFEMHATTDSGLPRLTFGKRREGDDLELWGIGPGAEVLPQKIRESPRSRLAK